jgi:hypothetical protein
MTELSLHGIPLLPPEKAKVYTMCPERFGYYVFGMDNLKTIGTTGFEPATYCSQSSRATKLRYVPLIIG